jgi:hypothetical protein
MYVKLLVLRLWPLSWHSTAALPCQPALSVFVFCCLPSVLAASAAGVCQACKDP